MANSRASILSGTVTYLSFRPESLAWFLSHQLALYSVYIHVFHEGIEEEDRVFLHGVKQNEVDIRAVNITQRYLPTEKCQSNVSEPQGGRNPVQLLCQSPLHDQRGIAILNPWMRKNERKCELRCEKSLMGAFTRTIRRSTRAILFMSQALGILIIITTPPSKLAPRSTDYASQDLETPECYVGFYAQNLGSYEVKPKFVTIQSAAFSKSSKPCD
jgi:hypothetical protein